MAPTVAPTATVDISTLADDDLLRRTESLALRERISRADLIEHLAEIDRRGIYPGRNYASLFEYCVHRLKMSEGSAYRRIRAARTVLIFPPVLDLLRDGRLTLEAVALLHVASKESDFPSLVLKASGLGTRQVEALLAGRRMEKPSRDSIRYVGLRAPSANPPVDFNDGLFRIALCEPTTEIVSSKVPAVPAMKNEACPPPAVAKRSVRFAFTADEDFYRTLEKARALLRHKYPDGRLEGVLFDALKALLDLRNPGLRWPRGRRDARPSLRAGRTRRAGT